MHNFLSVVLAVWPRVCCICSFGVFRCFGVVAFIFLGLSLCFPLCFLPIFFACTMCLKIYCQTVAKVCVVNCCASSVLPARLCFLFFCCHRLLFLCFLIYLEAFQTFFCVCVTFFSCLVDVLQFVLRATFCLFGLL